MKIPQTQYFDVLNTAGVVRYISFEGKAVPVPERQIDAIRYYLAEGNESLPEGRENKDLAALESGKKVEVTRGPMRGLQGELIEIAGKHKVRVEISAIGHSIMITIPVSQLREV